MSFIMILNWFIHAAEWGGRTLRWQNNLYSFRLQVGKKKLVYQGEKTQCLPTLRCDRFLLSGNFITSYLGPAQNTKCANSVVSICAAIRKTEKNNILISVFKLQNIGENLMGLCWVCPDLYPSTLLTSKSGILPVNSYRGLKKKMQYNIK